MVSYLMKKREYCKVLMLNREIGKSRCGHATVRGANPLKSLGNWEDGGAMNLSQENCLAEYAALTCE